ncbi:MAG: hypothetical protein ACYC36_03505 [Bellilinea sp.]
MSKLVPATADMIHSLPGVRIGVTCKAMALIDDGKVLAVGGMYQENSRWTIFLRKSPDFDAKRHAKSIVKGSRKMLESANGIPVNAIADPKIHGSEKLLEHLGFNGVGKGAYEWTSNQPK